MAQVNVDASDELAVRRNEKLRATVVAATNELAEAADTARYSVGIDWGYQRRVFAASAAVEHKVDDSVVLMILDGYDDLRRDPWRDEVVERVVADVRRERGAK